MLTAVLLGVLAPYPTYQWEPTIQGRRACWIDLRDGAGSPSGSPWGKEVYCTDLDSGEVWNA